MPKKTSAKHSTRDGRANFAASAPVAGRGHYGTDSGLTAEQVSPEAVCSLVRRFLRPGEDEDAKAFIALINAITYTRDADARETIAVYACEEAYRGTTRPVAAELDFCDQATAEFPMTA
jgi:hypothetical protein